MMDTWCYQVAQNCGDVMAELNTKLYCKKDGVTEEISVYTTLDEVQNQGVPVKVEGVNGYIKYGDVGDDNSTALSCKIPNDNNAYKIHKTAITFPSVTLLCYDVENEQQISSVKYPVPDNGILYLNNENAPSVSGYDFVLLEGVKHQGVKEDDVFKVYYVRQDVPDRNLENWDLKYWADYVEEMPSVINTYNATSMYATFFSQVYYEVPIFNASNVTKMDEVFRYGQFKKVPMLDTSNVTSMRGTFACCEQLEEMPLWDTSKVTNMEGMFGMSYSEVNGTIGFGCYALKTIPALDTSNVTNMTMMFREDYNLESVPSLNTSKVTSMYAMFSECYKLTFVGYLDTSKVTNMARMFEHCESLTHLDWAIDMSSADDVDDMFYGCSIQNVHLKNVPKNLMLIDIGTDSYIIDNYTDQEVKDEEIRTNKVWQDNLLLPY